MGTTGRTGGLPCVRQGIGNAQKNGIGQVPLGLEPDRQSRYIHSAVMIYDLGDRRPAIHDSCFVAESAHLIGSVLLEEDASDS